MAADVPATQRDRSSAIMVLTIQNTHVIVFQEECFQLPVPSYNWEMMKCTQEERKQTKSQFCSDTVDCHSELACFMPSSKLVTIHLSDVYKSTAQEFYD